MENNKVMGGVPEKLHTTYPSRYAIDETVDLDFQNSKYIKGCKIVGIKFTDYGKVLYDISIPLGYEYETTIENVDSILVVDPINE